MNEFHREGIVHFFPEAADSYVHRVGVAIEIHVPDPFGDKGSGENFPGVLEKEFQQEKFLGGEIQTLRITGNGTAQEIHFEAKKAQGFGACFHLPPENRPNTGQEFGKGKGLGEIVVGSRI